jgi:hypothetical protein
MKADATRFSAPPFDSYHSISPSVQPKQQAHQAGPCFKHRAAQAAAKGELQSHWIGTARTRHSPLTIPQHPHWCPSPLWTAAAAAAVTAAMLPPQQQNSAYTS